MPRTRQTAADARATTSLRAPAKLPRAEDRARCGSDSARATRHFTSDSSHKTEPPVAAGTTFAQKYYLERMLGRGAMGVVYLARDVFLEREVAIKILSPAHAADAGIADSFHREAVAMASVRHTNAVQIYTSGQCGGLHFFVM